MTRSNYGTGSIRQTGPNRWQIRWSEGVDPFTGDHIRRTETIHGNKTEANRALAARIAARGKASRVTLRQLVDATLPAARVAGFFLIPARKALTSPGLNVHSPAHAWKT